MRFAGQCVKGHAGEEEQGRCGGVGKRDEEDFGESKRGVKCGGAWRDGAAQGRSGSKAHKEW